MNLRALRYFVAIADAGSLTAAATAISIAQPALTRQLRELEPDLGAQLFQRTPRGVLLTQAGVTLYESAQRMLAEAARVRLNLSQRQDTTSTPVALGASPTLARLILPSLFENCQHAISGVKLRAREAFTPALLDWLERGMIDMAIVTNPEAGRALALHPLLSEPFALVSHTSLKLEPAVSVSQLTRVPVLMTSLHRAIVEKQLIPLGGRLNVQAEMDSVDSIRELVLRGRCATIMPVSVFNEQRATRTLRMSEVSGVQLSRLLVLATRLDRQDNSAQQAVREMIEAEFARMTRRGIFTFAGNTAADKSAA